MRGPSAHPEGSCISETGVWGNWGVSSGVSMKRKAKPRAEKSRSGNLLMAFAAAIAVLILLLRMLVFVAGHGRHHP